MRFYENARKEHGVPDAAEPGLPPLLQPYTAPFYSPAHAISNQMGIKTQAVFVGKLYAMLEDEEIKKSGLIAWSADGNVFSCLNPTEFSRSVRLRPSLTAVESYYLSSSSIIIGKVSSGSSTCMGTCRCNGDLD